MTYPKPSALYTQGSAIRSQNVEIPFYATRAPTNFDINYPVGKRWVTSDNEYCLTGFIYDNGNNANWTSLSSSGAYIVSSGITPELNNGSITVFDSSVVPSSIIIYSANNLGIDSGNWGCPISTITNGSFTIISTQVNDSTNFFYAVFNTGGQ